MARMIARPTAASAAATVITKKTKTWPESPCTVDRATKVRLTALSISSTHMKITIALRRTRTPATPITNRIAETIRAGPSSISDPPLGEDYRADDRCEQQHGGQLERHQVLLEERLGDVARNAPVDRGLHR